MKTIRLIDIAHGRSGDKGNTANIGLIAREPRWYPVLVKYVTPDRVKRHFQGICEGDVERFEMENIGAINFLLHDALDGGGTVSLRSDAQGKTYAAALLRMEIEVSESEAL